jgi:hypothetical protein
MPRTRIRLRSCTELRLEPVCARPRRTHSNLRSAARCGCSRVASSAPGSQKAPGRTPRARLRRACEGSSSAFPAPRRSDTVTLRSVVPPTSAGGRRSAEHREITQLSAFPNLSDGLALSSSGSRQLAAQTLESTALSRRAPGALASRTRRSRFAHPALSLRAPGALRRRAPRAPARPGANSGGLPRRGRACASPATARCDVAPELPQF